MGKSWWYGWFGVSLALTLSIGAQGNAVHTNAAPPAAVTDADPALWKVQGPHETVYLFGTVHLLKPDVHWQTKKVQSAFNQSDMLYLELAKPEDAKTLQPMVMQLGLDQEHPLSTKISADDRAALDKAVQSMGMPGEQMLEPMKPWLAYLTLSLLPMIKAGFSPTGGVDLALQKMAAEQHKQVFGFETGEQQLHFLANLPEAQQVALLHDELQELPNGTRELDEILSDWEKGDVDAIAKLENAATGKSPAVYKVVVGDRNQRFADRIATLLASPKAGVAFVAVGAAHLAGPDSVQADLQAKGYKVTRE